MKIRNWPQSIYCLAYKSHNLVLNCSLDRILLCISDCLKFEILLLDAGMCATITDYQTVLFIYVSLLFVSGSNWPETGYVI